MKRYVVLEKKVGETPLSCVEAWRATQPAAYQSIPLSYAGRLDPMASGSLLILLGDECKKQETYRSLDKAYEFEVLFGIQSDSGDVLGLTTRCDVPQLTDAAIQKAANTLQGSLTLPYPHFSSKTVQGKPLHMWTLEGRLDEIEIPEHTSEIYKLTLLETYQLKKDALKEQVSAKIERIPPVTDPRKKLGNDFRRPEVRACWDALYNTLDPETTYTIAKFRCIAGSGTYMRTLAEVIARELGTCGLAYSIHRTTICKYSRAPLIGGFWSKRYT